MCATCMTWRHRSRYSKCPHLHSFIAVSAVGMHFSTLTSSQMLLHLLMSPECLSALLTCCLWQPSHLAPCVAVSEATTLIASELGQAWTGGEEDSINSMRFTADVQLGTPLCCVT